MKQVGYNAVWSGLRSLPVAYPQGDVSPGFQAKGQSCIAPPFGKAVTSTDRAIDTWHPTAATDESEERSIDGVQLQ